MSTGAVIITQIAKTLVLISIGHRSYVKSSDRWVIEVNLRVFLTGNPQNLTISSGILRFDMREWLARPITQRPHMCMVFSYCCVLGDFACATCLTSSTPWLFAYHIVCFSVICWFIESYITQCTELDAANENIKWKDFPVIRLEIKLGIKQPTISNAPENCTEYRWSGLLCTLQFCSSVWYSDLVHSWIAFSHHSLCNAMEKVSVDMVCHVLLLWSDNCGSNYLSPRSRGLNCRLSRALLDFCRYNLVVALRIG